MEEKEREEQVVQEEKMMTYDEFKKDWLNRHRLSIPKITRSAQMFPVLGLIGGLILWAVILLATSVLSGAHSVPSVANTLPIGGENPMFDIEVARRIAVLGFAMIEGTIFAAAMYKATSPYAKWALVLSLTAGIMANESSSLHKVANWEPTLQYALDLIVGAIIGFAAPMTAYFAGEMVGDLFRRFKEDWKALEAGLDERKKRIEQSINTAYTNYENKLSDYNKRVERLLEPDNKLSGRVPSKKALELADAIVRDGNQDLTISDIQKTYEVTGRGIAADARKIARGEWS